jgi:hypothetical protein
MRRRRENAIIPLIGCISVTLLIYAFAILRGDWTSLLMGFIFIIGISNFLDEFIGRRYFLYSFSILISIFVVTLIYVNNVRNGSVEKIRIHGEISKNYNDRKYVHFELNEYPDISFKSYDGKIMSSFNEYTLGKNYEKKPVNIGKKASMIVYRSQLEWFNKPFVASLKNLRFPLEVEIESFEISE